MGETTDTARALRAWAKRAAAKGEPDMATALRMAAVEVERLQDAVRVLQAEIAGKKRGCAP